MFLRPRLFLIFVLACTAPLLLVGATSFLMNLRNARQTLAIELQEELAGAKYALHELLQTRQQDLLTLAGNKALVDFAEQQEKVELSALNGPATILTVGGAEQPVKDLQDALAPMLLNEKSYAAIAYFDSKRRPRFIAQKPTGPSDQSLIIRTRGFLEHESEPDARAWSTKRGESVCSIVSLASVGKTLRCATSVYQDADAQGSHGILVTDTRLDSLVAQVARTSEISASDQNRASPLAAVIVVLDRTGEIVYHTNDALKHQQVETSLPYFGPIATAMVAGQSGQNFYRSTQGDEWLAAYAPIEPQGLSLAAARNYSLFTIALRRAGWFCLALAGLFGISLAGVLTWFYQRRLQSLERVTEGVTAIAKGELDLHIDARSRDDIRQLAEGVNLVTERLREQLAREAETRQIESFVRLSAMLTHDLKNAIGGLSLLVSNMEKHFNNEAFRADAMRSLTDATEKLQSLVERLSNPITTLSGEYRRPQSVDVVPIVKKAVSQMVGQSGEGETGSAISKHEVEVHFPDSLVALVDGERIEKVFENLILNAVEAMADKPGKLTITGGVEEEGKIWVTVTDTGIGMSSRFIEEKLFRAFATTKKKGMGLGLYTCREVVRAHGGSIEVRSQPGVGTTFRVVLPSAPPEGSIDKLTLNNSRS
ncbi:MAG TPA: ATP-binding protein [Pyrinomonadaceae bacterium]|nr:ATP-binding protein [Pyrinomonadaceae bacterium]